MNESSEGSPITISAPSRARMMSSIPCLSCVPGAIREIAVSTFGSMRGSSSAALRGKPSGATGRRSCLSALGSVDIEPRPYRPAQSLRFEHAEFAIRRSGGGDNLPEPELRALFEPTLGLGRGPQPAREPDLHERRRGLLDSGAPCSRRDRKRYGEVGARLIDANAAGDVDEHVGAAESDARAQREDGDDHRQALRVDPGRDPPRHREVGRRNEGLDLERDRPGSLQGAGHGGTDLAFRAASGQLRGLWDADEPGTGHLEHSELVRRPEAVLHRTENPVRVVAVALELEHAVDEMLEHARTGDGAVLGHMADEEGGDVSLLRNPQESRRRLTNLRDRAGSGADLRRVERLHRVDHADLGPLALQRRADGLELRLREDLDVPGAAETGGA